MFKAIKAMPILPKFLLASLLLLGLHGLTHRRHAQPSDYESGHVIASSDNLNPHGARPRATDEAELAQQYLARFKSQQTQLQARAKDCMAQMQQATNQMAIAAMNGQMMSARPACEQYMPQWTAQEAYLETVIYQLQTGDVHSTMHQITGVQVRQSNAPSYDRPSGDANDGGIGAVENYDRQAVRGTSLYDEEDGTEHELPTEPYYFRNRVSGQIVSSNLPDAPNDGHDYEALTPQQ
jgi:hypothetical protein